MTEFTETCSLARPYLSQSSKGKNMTAESFTRSLALTISCEPNTAHRAQEKPNIFRIICLVLTTLCIIWCMAVIKLLECFCTCFVHDCC